MAKEQHLLLNGEIVNVLTAGTYRVSCMRGHEVIARVAGRLRRRRIRVVLGDEVTVAVSPYDASRGLIVRRA